MADGRGRREASRRPALDALDADAVRRWSRSAVEVLTTHRAEIDALNVFPVPDSDTGRNMLHTFRAGDDHLRARAATEAAGSLTTLSDGAARGAIGNSGFLLSQFLRGLAETATQAEVCDAGVISAGLAAGAELARAAVMRPVEGTMLTVAAAAARAAAAATAADAGGPQLSAVLRAAVEAADVALQQTPQQLAELGDAGVVDAGGRGLLLVLAALAATVTGTMPTVTDVSVPAGGNCPPGVADLGFEVQYLLDASEPAVRALEERLVELGESVAVVGVGPQAWKVHVHVDEVGPAIEAGVNAGRPYQIAVVRLADRAAPAATRLPGGRAGALPVPSRAIVVVGAGAGLAELLEREGVIVVDAPADAPHTAAALPDDHTDVILLPIAGSPGAGGKADKAVEDAAAQLRRRGGRATVLPVRSPVQALAAVAVHDAVRGFDDDVVAMAEAAGATRFAELVVADSAGLTAVGLCQPGDVLGLIDGDVVEIGHSTLAVAFDVLDRLLGIGAELVTVLVGDDAPPRAGELLEAHVRRRSPLTDVAVYPADGLGSPLILGAE